MNNTQKHAKLELDILYKNIPDTCIKEFNTEILLLCKKFGNSGQSGGSAPYTARILADTIKKLLLRETITPIFNNEEDWVNVSEIMSYENFYQNKRNGSIFKEGKYNKAYYIDAIVKRNQHGDTYCGSFWLNREQYLIGDDKLKINMRGYIKSFPFEPKTFYIDVIEEEVISGVFIDYCKDESQLEDVWKYYDKD